jgi:Peptidoglycan-synthase activator LpoB
MALSFAGCEKSRDELQPDMDKVMEGDHGPQCANLREMASRLAPSVLQCNDIARNPNRIVVVMENMENKTEDMHGQDMDIYLAKLVGDLNTPATQDRILFREQAAKVQQFQAKEGIGNPDTFEDSARTGQPTSTIIPAQYVMYGTVFSMHNKRTTYYLFQFHLTNIVTGAQVWSGQYDVRSLNE